MRRVDTNSDKVYLIMVEILNSEFPAWEPVCAHYNYIEMIEHLCRLREGESARAKNERCNAREFTIDVVDIYGLD